MDAERKLKLGKKGKVYTVQQFADKFSQGDLSVAELAISQLEAKGDIIWLDLKDPTEEYERKIFESATKEQSLVMQANLHDTYNEQAKAFERQQKRENRAVYKGYFLLFPDLGKAQEFELWVNQDLRLETEISLKSGQPKLNIYNLTDAELNLINRKYKAESTIQKAVGTVDKIASGATGAVDYTATKVVAPIVQVGAKAGVSILGTVAKTGAKTLGTLVTAVALGSRQCVKEIKTDEDVLKASRELINTKDSIKHSLANRTSSIGGGAGGFIE